MRHFVALSGFSACRRHLVVCRHLHPSSATAPTTAAAVASSKSPATPCPSPSAALSSTATTPTAEEYRALLLDLLLYRRETLEPVLAALRREREELETKMAQLETLVRELRHIREELRAFSEKKADEETQKLHTAITTAVAPPPRADEDGVSPPPMTRSSEADEIVL